MLISCNIRDEGPLKNSLPHPVIIKKLSFKIKYISVQIDYIISGHIHSARVGDIASRSSSLVGANEYSEKGLNLSGRASQNIYIFHENKNIDAMKIDLQYVGEECYDIDTELESYNAKSSNKLKPKKTIFEVTI